MSPGAFPSNFLPSVHTLAFSYGFTMGIDDGIYLGGRSRRIERRGGDVEWPGLETIGNLIPAKYKGRQ